MENRKSWTEADFRSFDSWKRIQAKVDCLNAITAHRMAMEKLEKLGALPKEQAQNLFRHSAGNGRAMGVKI